MKRTSLRRLAAGASAAALVSAGAFFGSSAAFAQPTPEETDTVTEPAGQSAETGKTSEDSKQADEKTSEDSNEKKVETKVEEPAASNTEESAGTGTQEPTDSNPNPTPDSDPAEDGGDDDAPAFDPQVSSAPDEITAADLTDPDKGITITASNLQAGDEVTNNLTNESTTAEGEELTTGVYYEGDPSDFEVGDKVDFTVTVTREGEESKTFDFTVTIIGEDDGDDERMEPKLKISPQKISVTDFRNENKGVELTVTNCYPGEAATFIIEHENGELSYEVDADTNDDGTAVIEHIHGTGNAPDSAYTGTYSVTVICGDGESDGTFSVHADDNGKGGGDSDKGRDRDRNELPRTGSDLTALYGAASLLAVGAAAMMVGRRKSPKQ
ncbi:hypothetical protein [Brevibacterium luteolum]|uniref:hypothetical protein n=1 Tax=Brevibacterium luteolum TaxID=199591 RepID=UPI00223A7641|nr:hypothetical protein [Brevibacterium luteolum]MCT1829780.1 hypothetical protein [Brevibacterium luteolum]